MLCIFSFSSVAQGELDDESKLLIRNERSFSLGVNSHGIQLGTRYAQHQDRLHKNIYEFQFISIHSPKEIKIETATGRSVYGKLNSVYACNFTFGKQTEKYSKLDKGSVAIFYNIDGGLTLGIEKPMYYEVLYPDDSIRIERFNSSAHTKFDKASFSNGLSEIKIIPGVILKSSVEFEFGSQQKQTKSLEFGAFIQAYPRKIEIMYSNENTWYFTTLFINYRIGKIIHN